MTLKTDSILNIPLYNETKVTNPVVSDTDIVLYNSALPENIDTFESEKRKSEEKSLKIGRKILKGVGITAGMLVLLAACKAVGPHKFNAKEITMVCNYLNNKGLGEFAKLTDFKTFSNVKMFSNLSKHEKKRMYNCFIVEPHTLIATLMGKKPAFTE